MDTSGDAPNTMPQAASGEGTIPSAAETTAAVAAALGQQAEALNKQNVPESESPQARAPAETWKKPETDHKGASRDAGASPSSRNKRDHERSGGLANRRHPPNSRVFIGNLASENLTKQEVVDVFDKYGRIVEEPVMRRSFGFVQYDSAEAAAEAIHGEQQRILGGRKIDLSFADNRDPRRSNADGSNARQGRRDDDRDRRRDGRDGDRSRGRDQDYDQDRRKRRRSLSPRGRNERAPSGTSGREPGRKRRAEPRNGIKVRILVMGTHARTYAQQCEQTIRNLLGMTTDLEYIESQKLGEALRTSRDQNVPYVIVVSTRDEENKTCTIRTLEATGYEKAKHEQGVITFRDALDVLVTDEGLPRLPPDFVIDWSTPISGPRGMGMPQAPPPPPPQQGGAGRRGDSRQGGAMRGWAPPAGAPPQQQMGKYPDRFGAPPGGMPMGMYDSGLAGAMPGAPGAAGMGRGADPRTRFDRGGVPPMGMFDQRNGGGDVGVGAPAPPAGGLDMKLLSQLSSGAFPSQQQLMQQQAHSQAPAQPQQQQQPQIPLPQQGGAQSQVPPQAGSQGPPGSQAAGGMPQQLDLSKITNLLSTFTQLQQMQQQQQPQQLQHQQQLPPPPQQQQPPQAVSAAQQPQLTTQQILASLGRFSAQPNTNQPVPVPVPPQAQQSAPQQAQQAPGLPLNILQLLQQQQGQQGQSQPPAPYRR